MKIYFAGAESPSHLERLRSCGVERVAVNVTTLSRRRSAKKPLNDWATEERLGGMEWILFADSPVTPWHPAMEVLDTAEVPPEMVVGPLAWVNETRMADMDLWFVPTWDGVDSMDLRQSIEGHEGVFLPDVVVDNQRAVTAAWASVQQPPIGFLGAITGRSRGLNRFDGVISSAWWSAEKYGETQVWAVNRMVRLSAEDKLTKRQKYRPGHRGVGRQRGRGPGRRSHARRPAWPSGPGRSSKLTPRTASTPTTGLKLTYLGYEPTSPVVTSRSITVANGRSGGGHAMLPSSASMSPR